MLSKRIKNYIVTIILLFSFLVSTIQVVSSEQLYDSESNLILKSDCIEISSFYTKKSSDEYILIECDESSSYINDFGKPMLPIIAKTYIFPVQTIIKNVECSFSDTIEQSINGKIQPASHPLPKTTNEELLNQFIEKKNVEDPFIYSSSEVFPQKDFEYSIGCGIDKGVRSQFLTIHCYPVTYNPKNNSLFISNIVNISISYEEKEASKVDNTYDMVIIAPRKFVPSLQSLRIHKNLNGINTKIVTTESIFRDALLGKNNIQGRDDAEKIKYFIKYAIETWDISYVLFVGGHEKQSLSWHVPVRYSNLHDRSFWNDSYVTDLYFADIYRYNQSSHIYEFDDWDSNGNDIIGEWTWIYDPERGWWYDLDKKDDLDLYPDVYIGRLACRDISEVKDVVKKIIRYESTLFEKDWFKNIILVGGDTVPYSDGICEGEIENDLAATFLEPLDFNPIKLWVTTESLTGPRDVIRELRKGAGFIYLSGHGTPLEWCTHPVCEGDVWIDLYAFQMTQLYNKNKLPVCIVGGCHNSQFDVTLMNIIKGVKEHGIAYFFWNEGIDCFPKWTWAPDCWSWNLVSQKNDGFIAAIGNTGLGWGVGGENCVEYNEGYLTTHFFNSYTTLSQQGYHNLGMMHADAINDYISHFSANDDLLDRKTVEQWVLLGDPSLLLE